MDVDVGVSVHEYVDRDTFADGLSYRESQAEAGSADVLTQEKVRK